MNPSFEGDTTKTIHSYSQRKAGSELVKNWYVTTDATSDLYNTHESTIRGNSIPKARTGIGRIALICGNAKSYAYREFITGKLIKPLEANKKYKVSFYVCRYRNSRYSPMQLGAYFTDQTPIKQNYHANIKVEPQVKVEDYTLLEDRKYWHKVEDVFTAAGGEKYITLGNFKSTMNDFTTPAIQVSNRPTIVATGSYCYIFFDDISVEEYDDTSEKVSQKKMYLFLVDASSSMDRDKKFKKLRSGLKKAVKKLPTDAHYGIITFAVKPNMILQPTRTLFTEFTDVLDTIKIGGSTNAESAIQFTYEELKKYIDYDTEIIMCTDGKFVLKDETQTMIKEEEIPVNLLQIGGSRSAQLDTLVNATNGKYVVTQNKNIKEDIVRLSSSAADNAGEVEYTKPKIAWVALKISLVISVGALAIFSLGG